MNITPIEWTDATWNPVTGCMKVSPGCKNCYAERVFQRPYSGICKCGHIEANHASKCLDCLECDSFQQRQFTDVLTHPDRLDQPLRWRKPKRIFVNSMSDLFHEDVPFEFVDKVFAVMALSPRHTFQILTKRPERMLEYLASCRNDAGERRIAIEYEKERLEDSIPCGIPTGPWPLPNVWLGVSVESQDYLHRIDTLKDIPASVRFVSFEPLLEDLGAVILDGIHWVIIGGESGSKSRPMHIDWVRSLTRQCRKQNVTPFFKQAGSNAQERNDRIADVWYYADGSDMDTEEIDADSYRYQGAPVRLKLKDRKGGDPAEWPEDLRVREFPVGGRR